MRNARRLLAALLAVVMLIPSILVPGYAAETTGFKDVREDSWYANAVDYVSAAGYMKGTSKDAFSPGEDVTRAMFVTILSRVARAQTDNTVSAFGDVAANRYYSGAIEWAAEKEIVNGVGGGLFAPYRSITRQDLAVMLYRFVNAMGCELSAGESRTYTDEAAISAYAADAVRFVTSTGLFAGYQDGSFRPKATATRAQTAVIVMRLAQLLDGQIVDPEPMPAQSFDQTSEQMQVSVNAPVGALPENTRMTVSRVTDEAALAAIAQKSGAEIFAAADITFTKDGAELEPEKAVEVQIAMAGLESIKNPTVVHVKDDGSLEYVAAEVVSATRGSEKALRFRAKDFSIYAVVDDGEIDDHARMLVKFMDPGENLTDSADDTLIYSVYVTRTDIRNGKGENGEDINLLPQIIEDPTAPDPTRNGKYPYRSFYGWAVVNGTTDEYNAESVDGEHDINRIRQQVYNKLNTGNIAEGDEFVVYAMIFNRFVVSYLDENQETVLKSTSYFTKENSVDITIDYRTTPYNVGKARFAGWQEDVGEQDIYDFGDDYTVTESVNFYALVEPGFYITFQENPDGAHKGASYRPPVFCENGVFTSADKPADPVLNGYIFDGWYRGEYDASYPSDKLVTDGNFWNNSEVVLSKNENLYAKWHEDPNSSFTVIVWKQKVTGGTTKPDSYDYAGSVKINSPTGGSLVNTNLFSRYVGFAGQQNVTIGDSTADFLGFKYSTYTIQNAKNTNQVNCGGVTVVNVYYDRETVTLNFYPLTYKKNSSYTSNVVNFGKYNNNYYPLAYYNSTLIYFYPVGSPDTSKSYYRYQNGTWYTVSYSSGRWYNSTLGTIDPNNQQLYAYEAVSDASDFVLVPTNASLYADTTYYVAASTLTEGASGTYYITYNSTYSYWYVYDSTDTYIGRLTTDQMYTLVSNSKLYTYENITIETYYTITVPSSPTTTMQGLYGSTLADNHKTWPETHWWYDSRDEFGRATGTRTTVLDAFIPASTSMTVNFYGEASTGDAHIYFQKQDTTGGENDYTTANSPSVTGQGKFFLSDKYNGFTCYQYKNGTNGEWITVGKLMHPSDDDDALYYDADDSTPGFQAVEQDGDIWVRFKRNQYTVQYMYGAFYDYKGTTRLTDMNMSGVLNVSSPVYYQASISKFDKSYTGSDKEYYDPTDDLDVSVRDNYLFVGWYENPECTGNPYVFTGKEMPLDGKILYAKFAQRGVRVFLHPNAEAGTGDGQYSFTQTEQGMNFAKAYGEAVNDGQEIGISRKGYDFVGWYYDEDMTLPYIFDTKMAANMKEALAYGETEKQNPAYYTDPGTNSDIDRPQVDQMIHLYARWRAHLDGAAGIHVHYEANENDVNTGHFGTPGVHVWNDNMVYVDGVKAIARTASTPTNHEDMQFLYWEILDPDGNSYSPKKIVYPGLEFDVLKSLANTQNVSSGNTAPNEPKMPQTTRSLENSLRPMTSVGPFNPLALDPVVSTTTWDFESDPTDWTILDNDGDGYQWYWNDNTVDFNYSAHGGNGVLASASYDKPTGTVLTPDNWAITPKITVDQYGTTVLTFWMASQQAKYPEKVDVYISETGNTVADFNLSEPVVSIPQTSAAYTEYTIPLTAYAGKDVYVGFRHHDVTDMFVVKLDDVVVTNTKQQYTVTFKNWNGDTLQTLPVVEGQAATYTGSTPTRENYTFVGWDCTAEELNCITSDLEVTAQFENANDDQWLVTFITTDGSFNQTVAVDKNTIIPADQIPNPPAKEGYVFYAWNKQAELQKPITSNLIVTAIYHRQETTVYTMNLRAVYGEKQKQPPTHITWYANNGVSKTMDVITHDDTTDTDITTEITVSDYVRSSVERVVNGETIQTQDLTTNEAVEIMPADTFEYPGYTFLGWARLDEATNQTKLQQTISEDDLFLKWCPDETYTVTENGVEVEKTGCFKARIPDGGTNAEWKRVTKVAANELRPYHGLFAVWRAKNFYVFHSATGKLEAYSYPDAIRNNSTFNLAEKVTKGYLYGGYYTSYGGLKTFTQDGNTRTIADLVAAQFDRNGNSYAIDGSTSIAWSQSYSSGTTPAVADLGADGVKAKTGFEAYTGGSMKIANNTRLFWTRTNAYGYGDQAGADRGNSLKPEVGTVYYLKEVPKAFLPNKLVYVKADENTSLFDGTKVEEGKITSLYLLTAVDDRNYAENGFFVGKSRQGQVVTGEENGYIKTADTVSRVFTIFVKNGKTYSYNANALSPSIVGPQGVDKNLVGFVAAKHLDYNWIKAHVGDDPDTPTFYLKPYWTTLDGVEVTQNNIKGVSITSDGKDIQYVNIPNP